MSLKHKLAEIENIIQVSRAKSGRDTNVKIIAVTKTHPRSILLEVHAAGIHAIGENRVQEAAEKFIDLPNIEKRFIGHLQSNKINKALELFDTIDSVHSLSLAKKIDTRTSNRPERLKVLLEVNTSGESSKSGFAPQNIEDMLACLELKNITVEGLMTVGPLSNNSDAVRNAFSNLRNLLDDINRQRPAETIKLTELSMGMSGDYEIAVEEGSTQVRLGTALFGERKPWPKPD